MKGFLEYAHGSTVLHRLHPLVKLLLAVLLSVSGFVTSAIPLILALLALDVALGYLGGVGSRTMGVFKTLLKLCSILFVVQLFFVREGQQWIALPLGLTITDEGLRFSALLSLRLMGATLPLAVMLSVTKLSDLTNALVSQAFVPYRYAFVLTTAIRFIPVLMREMSDVMEAQTARGIALDGNFLSKLRLIPPLCVPLLVASVQRMEGSALAAELRGFDLRTRASGYKQYPLHAQDGLFLAMGLLVLAVSMFI